MTQAPIPEIVSEHAEEAAFLWFQRRSAVHAPNYSPKQLADFDERLEAHVDGLRVAGELGWNLALEALDSEGAEGSFAASVLAIEAADDRLTSMMTRAEAASELVPGLVSAFGWVAPKLLGGRVISLLGAASPFHQLLGVAACALHRRDPGAALEKCLSSSDPRLRSRALRTAGELGRTDLLTPVLNALSDPKQEARFWGSWSGVLLGNRAKALDELTARALKPGPRQAQALQLTLQAMDMNRGHELLQQLIDVRESERLRVIGAGLVGGARYVPWLIEQMSKPVLARVAGEAFVNITGADFNIDQLEALPPDGFEDGPTEDPADENVEEPEDVALPWPDVERVKAWWEKNGSRFAPSTRYFLGRPLATAACVEVLKEGFQRQRVAAARYLALHNPDAPLFNTSAPSPRQQQQLASTG